MKITDVKTVLLTGPCTNDPWLSEARRFRSVALIEVHTDVGLTGIGETYNGYRCAELIPPAVSYFAPILIGQNVDHIATLYERMYMCENFWCRNGFGITVLNGIEAALWDLKGKAEAVPVYELLGGCKHDELLAYATGGPANYPPQRLCEKLAFYQSLGFRAAKIGAGCLTADGHWQLAGEAAAAADFEAAKLAYLRDNFDPDFGLMLDAHMGNRQASDGLWTVDIGAAVMAAVDEFELLFFEEPLHYDDPWGYAELCQRSPVPIAGGECLTGLAEWRTFIEMGCFDIGQPDASFSGGLELCVEVAARLAARDCQVAMHAWGAGPSLMQNVHVGFACPNTMILEVAPAYGPLHSLLVGESFCMRDGMVQPPETPGLGIQLTDEIKNRFPFIPGSGEFNSVPGKDLGDWDDRVAELAQPQNWS